MIIFQKLLLFFVLFSLSLVPWIDFINTNINEVDFIFNNNFIILVILYFFIIFILYLILGFSTSLKKYSLVSFITISIWILFQHSFIKNNFVIYLSSVDIIYKF